MIGSSGTTRDSESDELISDGEREAKESYRRKRMQEMMKMGSSERNGNSNVAPAGSRAKFGHLREIGQSQFVKAIEEKSDVTVVVHVYDPVSRRYSDLMAAADLHPRTDVLYRPPYKRAYPFVMCSTDISHRSRDHTSTQSS